MKDFEETFKKAYREAREEQEGLTPNFSRMTEPKPDPPVWKPALGFVLVLVSILGIWIATSQTDSTPAEQPKEIAKMIDEETFEVDETSIALAEGWEAPTDFLLVDSFEEESGSIFDSLDNLEDLKEL